MYPRFIAKMFCGEWWVFFYTEEHVSVLNDKKETQIEAELDAAKKNVQLFEKQYLLLKGETS